MRVKCAIGSPSHGTSGGPARQLIKVSLFRDSVTRRAWDRIAQQQLHGLAAARANRAVQESASATDAHVGSINDHSAFVSAAAHKKLNPADAT